MGGGAINQAGSGAANGGCAVSAGGATISGSLSTAAVRLWTASSAHPLNIAATAAVLIRALIACVGVRGGMLRCVILYSSD